VLDAAGTSVTVARAFEALGTAFFASDFFSVELGFVLALFELITHLTVDNLRLQHSSTF
jgi:hypothetical protein